MVESKFDHIKKIDLGLQERVDTGLMPSFYNFMGTYALTLGNLEGSTDMRPQLLTLLAMGYVRHKKDELMVTLERDINTRIEIIKGNNGGTVTNEERGRVTLEESVKMMADIVGIFDEKYEQKQCIGLMIPGEDMEEIDVPPIILDFNSHKDELLKNGVKVKSGKKIITPEDGLDDD